MSGIDRIVREALDQDVTVRETIIGGSLYKYKWTWGFVLEEIVLVDDDTLPPQPPLSGRAREKLRTTVSEKLHEEFASRGHVLQIESIDFQINTWEYLGRQARTIDLWFDTWRKTGSQATTFLTDFESESVSLALIALLSTIAPLIAYVIIAYFTLNAFEIIKQTVELLVDPDPPETFICPYGDNLSFETGQALSAHVQTAHPNENAFICGIDGASFSTAEELQAHKEEHHPPDPPSPDLLIVGIVIALIVVGVVAVVYLRRRG